MNAAAYIPFPSSLSVHIFLDIKNLHSARVADAVSSPVELVTAGDYPTLFQFFGLQQWFPFVFTHFQRRKSKSRWAKPRWARPYFGVYFASTLIQNVFLKTV